MKIAVIGGAGYIGSHTARELLDKGHVVCVFDNLSLGRRENLFQDAGFFLGDILDKADLERFFGEFKPEAVVHLAALKNVGDSMVNPEGYSEHNITGTLNILNAASRHGVKYFVFSSSSSVYGDPQYLPIDEEHPKNPVNFYGHTKLSIEGYLAWYSRLRNIRFAALRYFNAAGYDLKGRLTGLDKRPVNLIPAIMEALTGGKEVLVFGNDFDTKDGTGVRDYVHVNDLARGHEMALRYLARENKDLILNLGTRSGSSVLEIIRAAEKVSGRKVPYKLAPRREGDPATLIADTSKAYQLLGWEAECSDTETIMRTTWNAYLANGRVL